MINKFFKAAYYILISVILALALIFIVSIFPIPGNIETKTVLSGSMEPAIKLGSVIVIKQSDKYEIGDIITFGKDTKIDIPTTHRIVEMREVGGVTMYKTKGDSNGDPDAKEVSEHEIIGKTLFSIPYLGYLIDFAKRPFGFALIVIIPAAIIIIDEIIKIYKEILKIRRQKIENA